MFTECRLFSFHYYFFLLFPHTHIFNVIFLLHLKFVCTVYGRNSSVESVCVCVCRYLKNVILCHHFFHLLLLVVRHPLSSFDFISSFVRLELCRVLTTLDGTLIRTRQEWTHKNSNAAYSKQNKAPCKNDEERNRRKKFFKKKTEREKER